MDQTFSLFEHIVGVVFLLFAFFSITTVIQVTRRNRHVAFDKIMRAKQTPLVWKLVRSIAQADTFDILQFFLTGAQQGLRVCIIALATLFFCSSSFSLLLTKQPLLVLFLFAAFLSVFLILFFDFLPRYLATKHPETALKLSFALASLSIFLFFPFIALSLKIAQKLSGSAILQPTPTPREQLINLIDALDEDRTITETDRRLLQSIVNFRERIAREIMRPRVNVFCVSETVSLQEAASCMQKEGYSRVPVYKDTIDAIIGVIFYKDILSAYVRAQETHKEELLHEPITAYIKKIHYCPETKKISTLLQEMRKKQTHLALVVDEYGGTSGLVTIEDILEEIVGEISDEYDDVENFSQKIDDNRWVVDARANILDLEEETGIQIPQEGEYDTLSGYIFFRLGAIPLAGHVIHHDDYDMKIVSCNDRMVEKVEISLHKRPHHPSEHLHQ